MMREKMPQGGSGLQDIWKPSESRCAQLLRELVQTDTCQPGGRKKCLWIRS